MKISTAILTSAALLTAACSAPQTSSTESKTIMTDSASPAIITAISPHSFDETVSRVAAAIEKRPLNLFAQIDHAAGAAKADLSLAPSTLFILSLIHI